ncbi:GNAT family N-acetyltransferase [Demequina sp.]|uniref:GNAT family N-acetyltransferase n=1 Tax=Demequina sp. TaxID=2050685 RepID=UPI003D0B7A53
MSELAPWDKPTLVGDLVTLRPYAAEDADAAWEMVNDPEGRALTLTTASFTRAQIADWVGTRADAPDRLDLVIVENATGEFAGEAVLNEVSAADASANFRIVLRGPAWFGRGLGSEATDLMAHHAFSHVGLSKLTLDVREDNLRAIRAYEKAGFARTGQLSEEGVVWILMELAA